MEKKFRIDICTQETEMICCWYRRRFMPVLTIQLQDERCVRASSTTLVFEECPARLWQNALARLSDNTLAKLKLKKGNKTIGKQMMGARPIQEALLTHQHNGYVLLSLGIHIIHPFEVSIRVTFYLEPLINAVDQVITVNNEDCCSKDRQELYSKKYCRLKVNRHFKKSWITRLLQQKKVVFVISVTRMRALFGDVAT